MLALCILAVSSHTTALSQAQLWTIKDAVIEKKKGGSQDNTVQGEFTYYLNEKSLDNKLQRFDKEGPNRQIEMTLQIPLPSGTFLTFSVCEDDLLPQTLKDKYPHIRAYRGFLSKAVDAKGVYLRFTKNTYGYDFTIYSSEYGIVRVIKDNQEGYKSLFKRDIIAQGDSHFTCSAGGHVAHAHSLREQVQPMKSVLIDGSLRTYRIAIALNGEYTQEHGGTVSSALGTMVAQLSNLKGYFEWEHSISFTLVPNNDLIVFTDPDTDPYHPNSLVEMANTNNVVLNDIIGAENYDVGHMLGAQLLGGFAYIGLVCYDSYKGRGATSVTTDDNNLFDIDLWGHEIGHQFAATHTFYNSCNNARRDDTAIEVGSGTTTMSYSGGCAPNVLTSKDDYFHGVNIQQVKNFVTQGLGATCGTTQDLDNHSPVVDALPDYTIPSGTPFELTAHAADIDGDMLTYTWEQIDNQGSYPMPPISSSPGGPLFRSTLPNPSPTRSFPDTHYILNNEVYEWEVLPTVSRELNFRLTVRDNRPGNGLTAQDDITLTVVDEAGPFKVLSDNLQGTLIGDAMVEIKWDPAGTETGAISCQHVDVLLSTDGGLNFNHLLASKVDNNGSHTVRIPNVNSTQSRIKIQGSDHIFFDVSDDPFSIEESELCTDLAPTIRVTPSIITGIGLLNVIIKISEVENQASDGLVRVSIPFDERFDFQYNADLSSLGFSSVDNADWDYMGHNGLIHTFQTNKVISTQGSTFGFVSQFDPQSSDGKTSLTCTVRPFDGGECNVNNNSDSEFLDFFK